MRHQQPLYVITARGGGSAGEHVIGVSWYGHHADLRARNINADRSDWQNVTSHECFDYVSHDNSLRAWICETCRKAGDGSRVTGEATYGVRDSSGRVGALHPDGSITWEATS
jgi:hypothetical protein